MIFSILINIIIVSISTLLAIKSSKIIGLYDYPSSKRKIHKEPIIISGGFIIIFSLFLYFFYLLATNQINPSIKHNIIIFLFPFIFFCIGLYDDKFDLKPNSKLFLAVILYLGLVLIDKNLLISQLRFSFLDRNLELGSFSIFFTVFSFIVFLNALNMFDGINGQVSIYSIILLLLLLNININIEIVVLIIICLIFYFIFNMKNKMFLGDSGISVLAYVISTNFISEYNKDIIINADLIFLYFSIPGYELIRLTFQRLIIGKHPFSADNNHMHHYLKKIFNNKSLLIVFLIYFFPIFLSLLGIENIICILISILLYILTLIYIYVKLQPNKY